MFATTTGANRELYLTLAAGAYIYIGSTMYSTTSTVHAHVMTFQPSSKIELKSGKNEITECLVWPIAYLISLRGEKLMAFTTAHHPGTIKMSGLYFQEGFIYFIFI